MDVMHDTPKHHSGATHLSMPVATRAATSGSMAALSHKLLQRLGAGSVQAQGQWPNAYLPTAVALMPAHQLDASTGDFSTEESVLMWSVKTGR
jgi:hypothetical protein